MKRQDPRRKRDSPERFPTTGVRPPGAPERLRAPTLAAAKRALHAAETDAPSREAGSTLPMRWLWLAAMIALTAANLSSGWAPASPVVMRQGSSPFAYLPAEEACQRLRSFDQSLVPIRASDIRRHQTRSAQEESP